MSLNYRFLYIVLRYSMHESRSVLSSHLIGDTEKCEILSDVSILPVMGLCITHSCHHVISFDGPDDHSTTMST